MQDTIVSILQDVAALKQKMLADKTLISVIAEVAAMMKSKFAQGGTLYTAGNGGSACDAMHFAEELLARYKRERPGFRAMHMLDGGTISCWANDYSYDTAFARIAETFGTEKDMLAVFTTSGNSKNIIKATQVAKEKGVTVIAFTGKDGGIIKDLADHVILIPDKATERIQEGHIICVHILCELLET